MMVECLYNDSAVGISICLISSTSTSITQAYNIRSSTPISHSPFTDYISTPVNMKYHAVLLAGLAALVVASPFPGSGLEDRDLTVTRTLTATHTHTHKHRKHHHRKTKNVTITTTVTPVVPTTTSTPTTTTTPTTTSTSTTTPASTPSSHCPSESISFCNSEVLGCSCVCTTCSRVHHYIPLTNAFNSRSVLYTGNASSSFLVFRFVSYTRIVALTVRANR